jgi:hypothetical protein
MKVMLKNVRLSFPDLFDAVEFKAGDGKLRFNATFLIDPASADHKKIEEAIEAAAKEQFGVKYEKLLAGMRGNANKFCYLDGDMKDYDGYAGNFYLAAHSKIRPTVIDADKTPLTAQDGKPYSGCYVNASVDIWAQKGENSGVRASILGVQFFRDGEPFAGGTPADPDDFDDVSAEDLV